jgi:CHASE3 domain sensor protein
MKDDRSDSDEVVQISNKLISLLSSAILGALLAIAGYMVLWAINDSRWKGTMEEHTRNIEYRLSRLEHRTDAPR